MNLNQFRKQFPDEDCCRQFFESARWPSGRICPHCEHKESWVIKATDRRPQRYECCKCHKQYTVTTKTPLHATKLPLWTWLLAMYLIATSSKGIASTVLANFLGTTQPTAWKLGHCIRKMMAASQGDAPLLKGLVELDEKYLGGKPPLVEGKPNKRGKGTSKQALLIAVERCGPVRAEPIASEKVADLQPIIDRTLCKSSHLMSDEHRSHLCLGKQFAAHSHVNHSKREFSRGQAHSNTAESFSSILERGRIGVFHWFSPQHLKRYLAEFSFRWDNRVPTKGYDTKRSKYKTVMKKIPVMDMLVLILFGSAGCGLRRTPHWGLADVAFNS